jgi:hypothetical protein
LGFRISDFEIRNAEFESTGVYRLSRVAGSKRSPGEIASAAGKALPANQHATSRMSSVAPETAGELRSVIGAVHPTGPRLSIVEFTSTSISVHPRVTLSGTLLVPL